MNDRLRSAGTHRVRRWRWAYLLLAPFVALLVGSLPGTTRAATSTSVCDAQPIARVDVQMIGVAEEGPASLTDVRVQSVLPFADGRGTSRIPVRSVVATNTGGLADDMVVVRGGTSDVPGAGEVFSGSYGSTLDDAAAGVPHGQIRATTAGEMRVGGGSVDIAPELTRSGGLNEQHINICLGPGSCPFGPLQPNPVPKGLRVS